MEIVVKILSNDDGDLEEGRDWCLVDPCNLQGDATLCTAEFFGEGESRATYEVKRGKITCQKCVKIIKP